MKNHCKFIAYVGILYIICITCIAVYPVIEQGLSGVAITPLQQQQLAILLARRAAAAYVVYVMWMSLAEILDWIDTVNKRTHRDSAKIECIEEKMEELNKQLRETFVMMKEIAKSEEKDGHGPDFGTNKPDKESSKEEPDGKQPENIPHIPSEYQSDKVKAILGDRIQEKTMVCPSCGKQMVTDAAFCKHCGTKLKP